MVYLFDLQRTSNEAGHKAETTTVPVMSRSYKTCSHPTGLFIAAGTARRWAITVWVELARGAHPMLPVALGRHGAIFLTRDLIHDRTGLSDPLRDNDDSFVVQALSGGSIPGTVYRQGTRDYAASTS